MPFGAFGGLPGTLATSALSGGFPLGGLLGGLGSFFGANSGLQQGRDDLLSLSQFQPTSFTGAGGSLNFNDGGTFANFQLPPQLQFLQNLSGGVGAQGFGGGLFNDPNFQRAFQGNDIAGAFQGAQNVGNGGAGLLQGLGFNALGQAGNQQNLIQSNFDSLTALAAPGENRAANRLLDSQFTRGIGNSSVGADERAQQANRFLTAADQRALNAQQLGLQQQGLLQNFGLGAVGQGFNQSLTSGQSRLQNALRLFGTGSDVRNQGISQGFQAQSGLLGNASLALQAILGSLGAASDRVSASGQFAGPLAGLAESQGGLLGGLLGGIGSLF